MKFKWRLQRVLDLRQIAEDQLKAQLTEITQKELSLQSQIMLINAETKANLISIKGKSPNERLAYQRLTMAAQPFIAKKIETIKKKIQEVVLEKEQIKQKVVEARKARKGLELLKDKAKEKFNILESKREQDELDEITNISSARQIIHSQTFNFK